MLTKNTDQLKQLVTEHVTADSIIQGIYWDPETLRGCFIGCLAHANDPRLNEERYGLPLALQRIAENIFEALPADEAKAFFAALPDAVGCDGKDLSKVHWQFLAAELRSLPPQPDHIQAAIDPVIAGMDLLAAGVQWPSTDAARAAAAWAAVRAVDAAAAAAAADAADAADWAVDAAAAAADAADAADWAAVAWTAHTAMTAASAARAAARAAADAAAQTANAAAADCATARLRQRDLLLQLIKDAPVVEGAQ